MLQYRRRTACASALTVFALTDNIPAVTEGFVDILSKLRCFGKEAFIGISLPADSQGQDHQPRNKNIIANAGVIDTGIVFVNML